MFDDANFAQTHNVQSIHAFIFHQDCHEPQLARWKLELCVRAFKKKKRNRKHICKKLTHMSINSNESSWIVFTTEGNKHRVWTQFLATN